jgi:RNA polymerase sigma-B factor
LPAETVREASGVGHCFQPDSLDQPIGAATDATVGDSMGASDSGFQQAEARAIISPLLDGLGPRDRRLMVLRFFEGLTQRETGELIGVSQMQVSRVEARILRTFRDALAA